MASRAISDYLDTKTGQWGTKSSLMNLLLPERGADDAAFRQHFKKRCNPDTAHRVELLREWSVARAMVLSKQWLDLNIRDRDSRRAFRFTEPNPKLKFPRPVNNEIYPIYDNEVSKLARRKSSVYVRPVAIQEGSSGPAGASTANDIMDWHFESIGWSRKRRSAISKDVLYGMVYQWSYLNQSYMHTVQIGVTEARRCTQCDFTLASVELPDEPLMVAQGHEGFADPALATRDTAVDPATGDPVHTYTAKRCIACGAELSTWVPTEDELSSTPADAFNRPLSQDVPYNQPDIEVVPPWEIFLENDGIGFDEPQQIKEIYRVTPRRIDTWVAEHYPDLVSQVKRDDPNKIADFFPFMGEYGYGSEGHFAANERNLWQNHILVYTAVCKPKKAADYDNGRYTEFGGGILLRDEDLQRPSRRRKGVFIPLVNVTFSRYFIKDSEITGQGITVPLVSPQNRLNMMAAQIVDIRQRNSVNGIVAPFDMVFSSGWIDGHNGRFLRYRPSIQSPNVEPRFVETRTIDQGVYQEYDRTIDRMQQYSGAQDVDIGKAPRNVSAATAIQMLIGQTEGRRFSREEELIDSFRETYSHQLLLLSEFAREPRTYRAKNASNKWEYRTFRGMDLEGHTDVIVEEQAGYDAKAYQRESVLQAIQLGLLIANTPYARREILKALDIPTRAVDEDNVQISDADANWYSFRDFQQVPVPDFDLDDHVIMFQTYGRYLKTFEAKQLAAKSQWPTVATLVQGWEDDYRRMVMLDTKVRGLMAQVSMPLPPDVPPGALYQSPAFLARQTYQAMIQSGHDPSQMVMPNDIVQRVLTVWGSKGVTPDILQLPYTRFRAVLATHKIMGEQKKIQAMQVPTLAAAGGSTTPFGTEPSAGNVPMPAAGPGGNPADNSGNPPQLTSGMQG